MFATNEIHCLLNTTDDFFRSVFQTHSVTTLRLLSPHKHFLIHGWQWYSKSHALLKWDSGMLITLPTEFITISQLYITSRHSKDLAWHSSWTFYPWSWYWKVVPKHR